MQIPRHIAVIPDGNRRWAKQKGIAGVLGHQNGAKRFREISEQAFLLGVTHFTFWALSDENIRKREKTELAFLLALLTKELEDEVRTQRLVRDNVRFYVKGWWEELFWKRGFSDLLGIKDAIGALEQATSACDKGCLTLLLGYGGLDPLAASATASLPDVDLVIRTGEPNPRQFHNSAGFLIRQTANAVVQFPDVFWPDFTIAHFYEEIALYADYARRFGA